MLAAYASKSSFCVLRDERRPDLREAWFQVMSAIRIPKWRVQMKALTWWELAALAPEPLRDFLDLKYGIVVPGKHHRPPVPA